MTGRRTRVLVVEDSLTIRRRIAEELAGDPGIEVVGEAADGRRSVELCLALRPDAITMDMMMPVMTGLAATEHIMAYCPTPILVVSASVNRGEAFQTFDALAAGAVDVLEKPRADDPVDDWGRRLRAAVKMAARIPVIPHPRARLGARVARAAPRSLVRRPRLCAVGGSTGAPTAAARVLGALPAGYPLPILLVIHISRLFAEPLAAWLSRQSRVRVRLAQDREPLPPAGVAGAIMAPGDRHLLVEAGALRLSDAPERHACRPSVDVLFESVAREVGAQATACLLTGMGVDGAAGLSAIRRAGGHTIAQDERTSQIYGMPGEAVRRGAAVEVLPIDEIGPALRAAAPAGEAADSVGRLR